MSKYRRKTILRLEIGETMFKITAVTNKDDQVDYIVDSNDYGIPGRFSELTYAVEEFCRRTRDHSKPTTDAFKWYALQADLGRFNNPAATTRYKHKA